MKAPHCSVSRIMRASTVLMALICLCQCSMPPRESWQYIRTHGLVAYWSQPSPPFGAASSHSRSLAAPRYASTQRYYNRPSNSWSSYWDAGAPSRNPYNSYYSLSPHQERSGPARLGAPSRPRVAAAPSRPSPRPRVEHSSPPRVRIPVEEPSEPAKVASSPPPVRFSPPAPAPTISDSSSPAPTTDLPFGTPVPGRVNMVNSPFAGKTQLVDVAGMGPGQTVKCPYTGKLFKVPASQQASSSTEPRLESKIEKPKLSSEPPAEDKKP